ncbi:unnamed protein product, partial [Amoebophrya sp. A25]|eukprot:GSA25T00022383001.1
MASYADCEMQLGADDGRAHVWLPTFLVGVGARPKTAAGRAKEPVTSSLRCSEAFDSADLVTKHLQELLRKKWKKPVICLYPTDSGGSTQNQQVHMLQLADAEDGNVIMWPDFCHVHMLAISNKQGLEKFCRVIGRDPRVVEKHTYLVAWGANEKSIGQHATIDKRFS